MSFFSGVFLNFHFINSTDEIAFEKREKVKKKYCFNLAIFLKDIVCVLKKVKFTVLNFPQFSFYFSNLKQHKEKKRRLAC